MNYYTLGKRIYINEGKKPLGSGTEGRCYKKDNQVYKIYYEKTIIENGHDKSLSHQRLIGIKTKQIILPNALLFTEEGKYAGYRTDIAIGEQKLLKKQGISKIDSASFIRNLEILENDMHILANNYTLVADVTPINYIFDKDEEKMQIIDPGRYKVFRNGDDIFDSEVLKSYYNKENQKQLEELITILLYNDFVYFKPFKSKTQCQKLRDYLKNDKDTLSYRKYFKEVLKGKENLDQYVKSLGRYIR